MMNKLAKFVRSERFHLIISGVIIFNAIVLGLETSDYIMGFTYGYLHTLESLLVIFFVCEVGLRAGLNFKHFFRNGWDVFDLIIICLCIFPHFRSLSILMIFRILRRLPHMNLILTSIRGISVQILIVLMIMFILFYTFGVVGVRLYSTVSPSEFADLRWALLSLAQIMVGDSYGQIIRGVVSESISGWLYFAIVTVAFTFVIVNLFIAVVVGAIQSAVSAKEEAEAEKTVTHPQILKQLKSLEKTLQEMKDDNKTKNK